MLGNRWAAARVSLLVALILSSGSLFAASSAIAAPSAPPGTPTAKSFAGIATVGPIFRDGLSHGHGCTASVIASRSRNLILTSAHCVAGTAAGWQFAPGYDDGHTSYGVWTVTHAYLDPHWITGQDPQHDYAILQLARRHVQGRLLGVQDVTGANVLRLAPHSGEPITDVAYNAGIDDQPITCTPRVYFTIGYPSFDCHGYVGGSSGSPWLARIPGTQLTAVQGVIGGMHQGGCYEYTSYTSKFTSDVYGLLTRASAGRHPDTAPQPGGDGC